MMRTKPRWDIKINEVNIYVRFLHLNLHMLLYIYIMVKFPCYADCSMQRFANFDLNVAIRGCCNSLWSSKELITRFIVNAISLTECFLYHWDFICLLQLGCYREMVICFCLVLFLRFCTILNQHFILRPPWDLNFYKLYWELNTGP